MFLTANQIVRLYRSRILASMPTQQHLLESAISSPINQHHYTSKDNVFYLAAVLAQKIMLNHSFQTATNALVLPRRTCSSDSMAFS